MSEQQTPVAQMDATQLTHTPLFDEAALAAVVSGLPLLSIPAHSVEAILAGAFAYLRPGASFYQFTYGPRCPVPRAVIVLEAIVAHVIADALIEKLGGDSLAEMKSRFDSLRRARLDDLRMTGQPHVFWP